ncbi:MAG TPA: YcaO-like family protein [Frankiaceae bacterium]|nr:YcaO-like family protein [Frankiaceae bacterium]
MTLTSTFVNTRYPLLHPTVDEAGKEALDELLAQYNPVSGPVRKVITYFGSSGTMPINVGHSEFFDIDYILRQLTGLSSLDTGAQSSLFTGGKGSDLFGCYASSIGETVERVLGLFFFRRSEDEYFYGTYDDLEQRGERALSPDELPLFTPEQYAEPGFLFEPFTRHSYLAWLRGERLLSRDKVWVPAQMVELIYSLVPDEALIGYSVSGGLSSHVSRENALYHGITELIERDAVNLRWYCRLPPERLVFDEPIRDPRVRALCAKAARLPGELDYYSHVVDIAEVPVLTAMKVDPWLQRCSYYSGGGADCDIDTAIHKTVNEFGQSQRTIQLSLMAPDRIFAQGVMRLFDIGPDEPISKITAFFKVIAYYGHKQNAAKLDWYLHSDNRQLPYSELPHVEPRHRYGVLKDVLASHGLDPIVFDMTPPDLKTVRVMKVFIPELTQPFLQSKPILGHPRFAQAARLMGRSDEEISSGDLVADPLPYP